MSDIYLSTLTYTKPEIDQKLDDEATRVDNLLDDKSDKSTEGSPGGLATLNSTGQVETIQLPYATSLEAEDDTNITTVINPKELHRIIEIKAEQIDAVLDINTDKTVTINLTPTVLDNYDVKAVYGMTADTTTGLINVTDSGRYEITISLYFTSSVAAEPVYVDIYDITNNITCFTTMLTGGEGARNSQSRYTGRSVQLLSGASYGVRLWGDNTYDITAKEVQFAIRSIRRDTV